MDNYYVSIVSIIIAAVSLLMSFSSIIGLIIVLIVSLDNQASILSLEEKMFNNFNTLKATIDTLNLDLSSQETKFQQDLK